MAIQGMAWGAAMDSDPEEYDRTALLALTPAVYLRRGYRDERGEPWPDLLGVYATAVATQFEAAEASPDEVSAMFEAFRQSLPLYSGTPAERFAGAVGEALELVSRMMQGQANNAGIARWLAACGQAVLTESDLQAFVEHFRTVMRQYILIQALKQMQPPRAAEPGA